MQAMGLPSLCLSVDQDFGAYFLPLFGRIREAADGRGRFAVCTIVVVLTTDRRQQKNLRSAIVRCGVFLFRQSVVGRYWITGIEGQSCHEAGVEPISIVSSGSFHIVFCSSPEDDIPE